MPVPGMVSTHSCYYTPGAFPMGTEGPKRSFTMMCAAMLCAIAELIASMVPSSETVSKL